MTPPPDQDLSTAPPFNERRKKARRTFRLHRRAEERTQLLGGVVDLVRPEEVLHHLQANLKAGRKTLIANHNLNSLHLIQKDPVMARFYDRADLVEVDSTPAIYFAKLTGLRSQPFHRCTYLDWREHFWSLANRNGWKVAYLGGAPGVAQTAAERLTRTYPGAVIDVRHGYFDLARAGADNQAALAWLKAFSPDVLFVGMGMPRQEHWIVENYDDLPDCAVFSVGAAFDYEAGVQRAAPRWMGVAGLEWLYRLAHDPKRLFKRYCLDPWSLIPVALSDIRRALAAKLRAHSKQPPRGGGTPLASPTEPAPTPRA